MIYIGGGCANNIIDSSATCIKYSLVEAQFMDDKINTCNEGW
jgi:hypothetical protein